MNNPHTIRGLDVELTRQLVRDLDRIQGINIEPVAANQHDLNPIKVREYLKRIAEIGALEKEFVETILKYTYYVSWKELTDAFNESFDLLEREAKTLPIYVYFELEGKFSSVNIFTALFWHRLRRLNIRGFVSTLDDAAILPYGSNIVIVDDAMYTGNSISSIISGIDMKSFPRSYNYFLIIPYISTVAHKKLQAEFDRVYTFSIFLTKPLREQTNTDSYEQLYSRFLLKGRNQVPMYFDHKVAARDSTFGSVYIAGIIPLSGEEPDFYGSLLLNDPDETLRLRVQSYFGAYLDAFYSRASNDYDRRRYWIVQNLTRYTR